LYKKTRFEVSVSGTFWLSNTPDHPSKDWDSACLRVCTWAKFTDKKIINPELGSFVIFNTHLDHMSVQARQEGLRLIKEKISQHQNIPIILTGDFNAIPSDQLFSNNNLTSVGDAAMYKKNPLVGTLTLWEPRDNNSTIDYIFVNERFVSVRYEVITEFDVCHTLASDHRPIMGSLKFK